ncbi:uncharacterized protein GJ701_006283 [Geothlypis trichas]
MEDEDGAQPRWGPSHLSRPRPSHLSPPRPARARKSRGIRARSALCGGCSSRDAAGPSLERCAEPRTGGCSRCCAGLEALRRDREQDPGQGIRVRVLPVSGGGPGLSRFLVAGPQNRGGIAAGTGNRDRRGLEEPLRDRHAPSPALPLPLGPRLLRGCSRCGSGQVPLLPRGAGAVPVPGPAGERRIPGAGAGSRLEAGGARGPPEAAGPGAQERPHNPAERGSRRVLHSGTSGTSAPAQRAEQSAPPVLIPPHP